MFTNIEGVFCVDGGEVLDNKTLKSKVLQDYDELSLPQSDARASYSSFYFLVARLLMSFHR